VLSWLVSLLVPIVLVLLSVRILISPLYLQIEYNTPGFPSDQYGFTKEDRLVWSRIAVQYLLNSADISFLADLHFPDGQKAPPQSCQFMVDCARLYNARELEHMVDVKNVVKSALTVLYISLGILAGFGIWAYIGDWFSDYRRGLRRGGWITVGFIIAILLFVALAFSVIFVLFHNIFFESGTWTFFYSDTLIRLFPERFWRDTFIAIGILAGGSGLAFGLLLKDKAKGSNNNPIQSE
jgi:integral membrane protein (TIGR01906 family)